MSAGRHARPRPARALRWYLLPMPLAALAVVIMPWMAVRDVRRSHSAFRDLCDILLIAHRREQAGHADEPRPRHLYAVK